MEFSDIKNIDRLVAKASSVYYQRMEDRGEDFHVFSEDEIRLLVIALEPDYMEYAMIQRIIDLSEDNSFYLQNR